MNRLAIARKIQIRNEADSRVPVLGSASAVNADQGVRDMLAELFMHLQDYEKHY